ncbi:MAG: ABC transporter permease, partial [Actinomycetota bacterium]|nr:ABC transporter permease [Actinomycetota bacterium]
MSAPTSVPQQESTSPTPGPSDVRPHGAQQVISVLTGNWVFLALIAVTAVFAVWGGGTFLSVSNFRDILWNSSTIILLAIGTSFLIIGGQLDLSIGSVLVFSSVVGAKVIVMISGTAGPGGAYPHPILGILVGGLVCIITGAAWGLLNGILVTRLKIPSFVVTLGTLGMALGLAQVIGKGTDVVGLPPSSMQKFLSTQQLLGIKIVVWIALAIALIAGIVLAKTRFGRYTYAVGSNSEAARRGGV